MEDGTSLSFRGTKVFILGMNFFFAFMAFLFCARWAGHLSCLMAVPPAPSSHQDREIQVFKKKDIVLKEGENLEGEKCLL